MDGRARAGGDRGSGRHRPGSLIPRAPRCRPAAASRADPTRSLIAAVTRGTTVALHDRPGGRQIERVTDRDRVRLADPAGRGRPAGANGWRSARRRPATAAAPGSGARRCACGTRATGSSSRSPSGGSSCVDGSRVVFRTRVAVGSTAHPTPDRPVRRHRQARGPPLRQRLRLLHPRDLRRSRRSCRRTGRAATGSPCTARTSPASLGSPVSTGCVRVGERPLRALMRSVPLGTPVIIRN